MPRSTPWDLAIPAYARRLGARYAHRIAERVLLLALLRAYVGDKTLPPSKDQLDAFLASLPAWLRPTAKDTVARLSRFVESKRSRRTRGR